MILNKLELLNFKKYKSFSYNFEEGLTGIAGRNGAGKSTIFDAIHFGLYGDVRYLGDKESIKTSDATSKDPVKVIIEFEIDNSNYRVIREFRGKALTAQASLYDSQENQMASGTKEVNIAVAKLIGMTKDAFLSTVFASQKELTFLSTMHHEDRKKMIRKLLGLEKIDAVETLAKEHVTDLNRDIKAQQQIVITLEQEIELQDNLKNLQSNEKAIQTNLKTLESSKKSIITKLKIFKVDLIDQEKLKEEKIQSENNIQKSIHDLKNTESNLQTEQNRFQELKISKTKWKTFSNVRDNILSLEKQIEEQQKLKNNQSTLIELIKADQTYEKDIQSILKEINILKDSLKTLDNEKKKLEEIDIHIKILIEKEKNVKEQGQREKEIIATQKQLLTIASTKKEQIESIGANSPCPICTRPLLDQYESVMSDLNKEIMTITQSSLAIAEEKRDVLLKEYRVVESEIKTTQSTKENITKNIYVLQLKQVEKEKYTKRLNEIIERRKIDTNRIDILKQQPYDEKIHQGLNAEYKILKPKYEEWLRLDGLIKEIPKVEQNISKFSKSIKKLIQVIDTAKQTFENIKYNKTEHRNIQSNWDSANEQKDILVKETGQKAILLAEINKDITSLTKEINKNENLKKKLINFQESLNDYLKIRESLDHFKTMINGKVSPRISQIASELFGRITNGKYQHIEVNADFDFFIYENGTAYPIDRFSGGEIDLANLVLRIAISKTLSELSGGAKIEFLAFDEIFGSQDEERRQEVMNAFQLISEQYKQIFLITHEAEIKEQFPRVLEL